MVGSAFFWNITQCRVVILYRRFGTTSRALLDGTDRLSRNAGYGTTIQGRVESQKTADLIYVAAEAWDHTRKHNGAELSHWEAESCPARHSLLLRNPTVNSDVLNSPPLQPSLSQLNSVHTHKSNCFETHSLSRSHLHLGLPGGVFPSGICKWVYPNKKKIFKMWGHFHCEEKSEVAHPFHWLEYSDEALG